MFKEPNMSKNTKCRICNRNIHDVERIKVDGPINSYGRPTHSYFHVECVRAITGYDITNEQLIQHNTLIDLLAKMLKYATRHKYGKIFIDSFIETHPVLWKKAKIIALKEILEK